MITATTLVNKWCTWCKTNSHSDDECHSTRPIPVGTAKLYMALDRANERIDELEAELEKADTIIQIRISEINEMQKIMADNNALNEQIIAERKARENARGAELQWEKMYYEQFECATAAEQRCAQIEAETIERCAMVVNRENFQMLAKIIRALKSTVAAQEGKP